MAYRGYRNFGGNVEDSSTSAATIAYTSSNYDPVIAAACNNCKAIKINEKLYGSCKFCRNFKDMVYKDTFRCIDCKTKCCKTCRKTAPFIRRKGTECRCEKCSCKECPCAVCELVKTFNDGYEQGKLMYDVVEATGKESILQSFYKDIHEMKHSSTYHGINFEKGMLKGWDDTKVYNERLKSMINSADPFYDDSATPP